MVVVNRWGNIVYQSLNLLENWDGTDLLGESVSVGTYFYRMDVFDEFGTKETKSGFITVLN